MDESFNRVTTFGVQPIPPIFVSETRYDFSKENVTTNRNPTWNLKDLSSEDVVPFWKEYHSFNPRIRIVASIDDEIVFHIVLQKPYIGPLPLLLESKEKIVSYIEAFNNEILDCLKSLRANYTSYEIIDYLSFDLLSTQEIRTLAEDILKDNSL